jgi:hypothetical protein
MRGKCLIQSTTPAAGSKAWIAAASLAVIAIYYRLALPFFLLSLYLCYLLWSHYWTRMSCISTVAQGAVTDKRIFAGESFVWEFRLSNEWALPLVRCGVRLLLPKSFTFETDAPVSVSELSTCESFTGPSGKIIPKWNDCVARYAWLPQRKGISIKLQIEVNQRGVYYLPPVDFFTGDPSGLFKGINRVSEGSYLYVFPELQDTEALLKTLDYDDNHREDNFGMEDRYQIQGVRDYQHHDSPKAINWYATARTGDLKTNLFQRKDSEYCLVALDLSVANQPAYEVDCERFEDPALEQAISIAAGIALYHLEQGARVAFFTNAPMVSWKREDGSLIFMKRERATTILNFAEGEHQAQRVLELCAAIDETGRAFLEHQKRLWARIKAVPQNTLIYLLGHHGRPRGWDSLPDYRVEDAGCNPADFYTSDRLTELPSSRVRLISLPGG